jgi:catalase
VERFLGGSPENETALIARFQRDIQEVQDRNKAYAKAPAVLRALHAKVHLGVTNAEVRFHEQLPGYLRLGAFQPGARYRAAVRISNSTGLIQPDGNPQGRGLVFRMYAGSGVHDIALSNSPTTFARSAMHFMAAVKAGASQWKLLILLKLIFRLGLLEAFRIAAITGKAEKRHIASLAEETFWSRTPYAFGPVAVKLIARPVLRGARPASAVSGPNHLRDDLTSRLRHSHLTYDLLFQLFVEEHKTPLEDSSIEWLEADAPAVPFGTLTIPQQDLGAPEARQAEESVNLMAFNPGNTTGGIRPLGSLNRARIQVYAASAEHRGGESFSHQ